MRRGTRMFEPKMVKHRQPLALQAREALAATLEAKLAQTASRTRGCADRQRAGEAVAARNPDDGELGGGVGDRRPGLGAEPGG